MRRLRNSWNLFGRGLSVVGRNPKLLVIPAFNTVFALGVLLFYLAVPLFQPTSHPYDSAEHWREVARRAVYVDEERKAAHLAEWEASVAEMAAATEQAGAPAREEAVAEEALPGTEAASAVDGPAEVAPPDEELRAGDFELLADLGALRPRGWVVAHVVCLYLLSVFLATFLTTALHHEVIRALDGDGVSLFRGLGFATSRIPALLGWSLLVGAIGLILKAIEERLPYAGRITAAIFGTAFNVAAVFAVPVLVMEDRVGNPFRVLKRSVGTLRKAWGEALVGFLGIRLVGWFALLCAFPVLLAATLGTPALAPDLAPVVIPTAWIVMVLVTLWIAYLQRLANVVYGCALYRYAATGDLVAGFDRESLDAGWKTR